MKTETGVAITVHAPGCYGHASVFAYSNPICKACPAFAECGETVTAKLKAFAEKADVSDHSARHTNGAIDAGVLHALEANAAEVQIRKVPKRRQPVARVKVNLTPEDAAIVESMPVKVRVMGRNMIASGEAKGMLAKLRAGENPFPFEGKRYLHVACEMLLQGGFTKASLRERYMTRLSWSKETSFSHVSMAISIFTAFGVIEETKAGFIIKPAIN